MELNVCGQECVSASLEVLEGFADIQPFMDSVCAASDAHRNELGFFPRSVLEQFARRDELFVLVAKATDAQHYAGHLLFNLNFPRASVRQICTVESYRRKGAASMLLNRLKHSLMQYGFTSIYARVAEDLSNANAFWHRQGFYVQRTEAGGISRKRRILVRCHELDSPQLFPSSGLSDRNPLGLHAPNAGGLPMYLLDLNVLFDIQPRRLRRSELIGLFQAERMNACRLAISSEIREELQRSLQVGRTDPMEAFVETFPCFPLAPATNDDPELSTLAAMIFPNAPRELAANERSDLRHVMTAIKHDLDGLITNDGALLDAAPFIKERYGVQILPSHAFEADNAPVGHDAFETVQNPLRLLAITSDTEAEAEALLKKVGLSGTALATSWLPRGAHGRIATRFAVWAGVECVGYLSWSARVGGDRITIARAAIDEAHPQGRDAARILLLFLVERLSKDAKPGQVMVELPQHQSLLREVGAGLGFVGAGGSSGLLKSMLSCLLNAFSWSAGLAAMAAAGAPRLTGAMPTYRNPDQLLEIITPKGNRAFVALDRLESLLMPALFCLPGRPAVIAPVRRLYAEPLLGHSPQRSLLPLSSASLFADRIYVSKPSTLKFYKRGTLMFFYESSRQGGRKAIVAVARVREAYLRACDEFDVSALQQSVLTQEALSDLGKSAMRTVTRFDNIFIFPRPVGLARLKFLGCGHPNDLITTHPISDEQSQQIINEGFASE